MQLHEANKRLKTKISEEELWSIHEIYCLMDFTKDEFCKIVDTLGVEVLASKKEHFARLAKAEQMLKAKERHLKNLTKLEEVKMGISIFLAEAERLEEDIALYLEEEEIP
ncbi:MAG: hypothetical protein R3Y63_08715 [Eubacteriales bacterium]